MTTLDGSIVNIALPYIMKSFATKLAVIQWVVMIYLLVASSLLLPFGRISDIKGKKIVYCSGFFIFSAGSLFCALSSNPLLLITGRGIQGCGAAMLMACSPALIVDNFPASERGKALGMIGTIVAAGLSAGPFTGGLILQFFSWRMIFYLNIPLGIGASLAGLYILKGSSGGIPSNEPLDIMGSVFVILWLTCSLFVITHFGKWGLSSSKTIGMAIVSILAGAGFMITEAKSEFPLFSPDLVKIRLFILPVISAAVLYASLFTIVFMTPFYLTYPCGFSASKTGMIMTAPFVLLFFVCPVSGSLYDKIGSRELCLTGMLILAASLFSFTFIEPAMPVYSILWRLAMVGIGTGLFISPNSTAAMSAISVNRRGIASAAVATARNLGMVTGVALAGLIFSSVFNELSHGLSLKNYSDLLEPFFMAGFHRAMMAGAVIALAGSVLSYMRGPDKPVTGGLGVMKYPEAVLKSDVKEENKENRE